MLSGGTFPISQPYKFTRDPILGETLLNLWSLGCKNHIVWGKHKLNFCRKTMTLHRIYSQLPCIFPFLSFCYFLKSPMWITAWSGLTRFAFVCTVSWQSLGSGGYRWRCCGNWIYHWNQKLWFIAVCQSMRRLIGMHRGHFVCIQ